MSDLIDRKAAIDAIRKDMYADKDYMSALICDGIEDVLKSLPSAQPEIIRCKDCKYGSPNKVYGCRLEPFSVHDRDSRMYADDFCSRAERKGEQP